MDESSKERSKVWMPLLFSLVLIFGMILGFNLKDTLRNKRDIVTVMQRNDRLEEIIDLISDKYTDTVNSNVLYQDAINGILGSLDPHTLYFPAEEAQSVNDDLEGGFSGIGVEFSIVRDTIQVTSVIDNGPASHAGVQVGDELIKVGDSVVAGNNITPERIAGLLRGRQKTSVDITLKLASDGAMKELPVTRDIIPVHSINAAIMLDSATGYIKIDRFTATTYSEFTTAMANLRAAGASRLVLDLRDNPGGYLDQATSIASTFLTDNKLIVYTQGVHSPKTEYKASGNGSFPSGRLVVLVDEGSASASEILSGAMQDWDRGVVVGRRTYGKGLVQEQYDMPDGAALRLTVAKYYTPSGRCIQRSFAHGREAYEQDYEHRFKTGELTGYDTVAHADTAPFYTADRRVVYGGGGINPDVYVPYDTAHISPNLERIIYGEELKAAIWDYFIRHRYTMKYKTVREFSRSFPDADVIADNYIASLAPVVRATVTKELRRADYNEYLHTEILAQLARYLYKDNGYYAIALRDDEMVRKAQAIIRSDEYSRILHPEQRH